MRDFSVNLNPLGTPKFVEELLAEAVREGVHRVYPDDYRPLKETIGELYDVPPESVGVFNGATQALLLLPPSRVPEPNFSEYRRSQSYLALEEEDEFRYPLQGDRVITGNPVNPTGSPLDEEDVISFLSSGGVLTLDESFADISPVRRHAKLTQEFENLLVVSSLTKMLAVPGLRIGITLGYASSQLEKLAGPWRVNSLIYYVLVNASVKEVKNFIDRSRERVSQLLAKVVRCPLVPYRSSAPFFLARSPIPASVLNHELRKRGFVVRDASDFIGLSPRHVRVALRDDLDDLCIAISEVLTDPPI
ncbi:aspartate aminotransferase [Sulfodiicoccus acidiphilus]|uniref:Aminotransferase n=1 Tax=Sulfodiicoccus acidiphilus TaxID=1670455 RepID=A0A348B3D7_9CREN|nr:aminotransferase class I/II-fold pyridoxal phosphate-dependent enzyme [Sulfodiicoccus acidiphilus]BBD72689.1 aspartate aminotransferase [Sulfodiicoccus acidiphilus]GGT95486.1 aspartate aminotransferase [Sulfodiicoccus acidiphilus]